ncbi:MAG: serine/threonine protein kinase/formylglycine-generating enzyme required for sulfatase activity [Planctomycetota bacterium]|jgi:serine/threonine protein kinase/formylglycine-generating enzyme required for sulfatase activity
MNDRLRRIRIAFEAAIEIDDPEQRARALHKACNGDAELIAEVERLLANAPPPQFLRTGETIEKLGEFELLEILDRGSMGVVWRAYQPSLNRQVAIKVMTVGPGMSESMIERFHREPRAVASIRHPHIVPVYADGRDGANHWFAMHLVEGHSLGKELQLQQGSKQQQTLLPPSSTGAWFTTIAGLCADVADALQSAHEHSIVHRDIKPQNLLLDKQGRVQVADFGIARDDRLGTLTDPGTAPGTLHYMSPEQARVLQIPIDHRTDVYSLGVVLYEALTLVQPFAGSSDHDTRNQILRARPKSPRSINNEIPRDLETVCLKAIERDPADRYADAAALADDLQRFLDHRAIHARMPSLARRIAALARVHGLWILIVSALFIAVSIGETIADASSRSTQQQELLSSVRTVMPREANTWEQLSPARLNATFAATQRLRIDSTYLSAPDLELLARSEAELDRYREELVRLGRDSIATGRPTSPDPAASDGNVTRILEGWNLLLRAYSIYEDETVLEGYSGNPIAPALTISARRASGQSLTGHATYRAIDLFTGICGPEVELGPLPLDQHPVDSGYFRIIVHLDQIGIREFSRHLISGYREHTIDCIWRPEQAIKNLAEVPSGILRLEDDDPFLPPLDRKPIDVTAFRLARHEVTVGEWRIFEAARRDAKLPPRDHWMLDRIAPDSLQNSLPIVDIGWRQAREFAEWYGCRLPTFVEYSWAARGPTGRQVPWLWGKSRNAAPLPDHKTWFGNVHGREANQSERADRNGFDLTQMRAVGSDPQAATPAPMAVNDLLGNVREWLESSCPNPNKRGGLLAQPTQRMAVGGHWTIANKLHLDAPFATPRGIEDAWDATDTGFRIATSRAR